MAGDEADFETMAEQTLERLAGAIEEATDRIDVDLEGGVLTLELDDGRTYLLNRHAPLRQLWLSSPVSGASHYAYGGEPGAWRSTRDGSDLLERLAAELGQVVGSPMTLR